MIQRSNRGALSPAVAGLMTAAIATFAALGVCAKPAHAQNYVTILYETYSNEEQLESTQVNGDVSQMMLNAYTPGYNWWGKPYFASVTGDQTIKNNYLHYFGSSANPNNQLIDYHMDLLARAGIDFISIDFTNGSIPTITEGARALCNRIVQRQAMGWPNPKVAFFVQNASVLQEVQNDFYNVYPSSVFFYYQGKPFAEVAVPNTALGAGDHNQPYVPTGGIFDQFTCRHCWGLDTSGSFWQFKTSSSAPPPACYFNGAPEEMSAAFACQSTYMTTDGVNPAPGAQGRANGAFFNNYWNAILQTRPIFTFITGWNEWGAINGNTPPAGLFTDQWKEQYSSDAEPEALNDPNSHGYQYYDLMAQKIGQLKGYYPVASGHTYNLINQASGEALDDTGWSTTHGTIMEQWDSWGGPPQQWTFTDQGDGNWTIVNAFSQLALDDLNWGTTNGTQVDQWDNWGGPPQQWRLRPVGDGTWLVVSALSNLCLDNGGSTTHGTSMMLWQESGSPNQHWTLQLVN